MIGILFAFPEERQKAFSLFEGKGQPQARQNNPKNPVDAVG
jgi:hypothetical protein